MSIVVSFRFQCAPSRFPASRPRTPAPKDRGTKGLGAIIIRVSVKLHFAVILGDVPCSSIPVNFNPPREIIADIPKVFAQFLDIISPDIFVGINKGNRIPVTAPLMVAAVSLGLRQ